RKQFKAAGCDEDVILTTSPGYLLHSAGHRIDTVEFADHVAAAHTAMRQGHTHDAVDQLGTALDLWRGPALDGVSGHLIEADAALLEEQRLSAYETRTALLLELGQPGSLIPDLTAVTQEHPLREQLRAQLMLAQYRAGRRAEALATFRLGREHSLEEIGIEPGPALRALHDAILRDDPSLVPAPRHSTHLASVPTPAQLPPDLSDFIGRTGQLSALDHLLTSARTHDAPAVGVVTGPAGAGKSQLVLHWAHRVAEKFPDGQLFADLRGYDTTAGPSDPGEVLGRFLRALGTPSDRIPDDTHERTSLYRSILGRQRVLVILDNVATAEQVSALLPGNGDSCVLLTSRSVLVEPLVGNGATRIRLGLMSQGEANALLRLVAGEDRVAGDPEAVARLGELCGWLPLALRIAADRLVAKPHWTIRRLVDRLEDDAGRLDELDVDDHGPQSLRDRFQASYQRLSADTARMYRMLGLFDAPQFAAWIGAALLNIGINEAERLMEQLVDAHLLEVDPAAPPLHYRFHELLRLHARELATNEESPATLGEANERVLNGLLTLVTEARRQESHSGVPVAEPLPLDENDVAELLRDPGAWLAQEWTSIKAAMHQVSTPALHG
ncbi:MAG: transcriptional regulator, partial [Actinobacteria bacterium]|nr:transcriptional regulator [Actinomycetota bacterium]